MSAASLVLSLWALASASPARSVVMLSPEDRAMVLGPVFQVVRSQTSDLAVELRVVPVPQLPPGLADQLRVARGVPGSPAAVIWFDLAPGESLVVHVADPKTMRVSARTVAWDKGGGHLEAAALIVRSSIKMLLSGSGPESVDEREGAEPERKPIFRAEGLGLRLSVCAGYSPGRLSSSGPTSHGVEATVSVGGSRLFGELSYRFVPLFIRPAGAYVYAQISRNPVGLGGGLHLSHGSLHLRARLDLVADLVSLDPRSVAHNQIAPPSRRTALFFAAPQIEAGLELFERMSIVAAVGADIPLGERRYLLPMAGLDEVLLTPWAVQPRGLVGLRWDIL